MYIQGQEKRTIIKSNVYDVLNFRVQSKQQQQKAKNQNKQRKQNMHSKFGLGSEQKILKKSKEISSQKGLSSLSIREIQIKKILRFCPTPDTITKLNKADDSKYWGG